MTQEALPAMGDYLSLVMQFILAFGVCFQLPVLLLLLNRAGLVTRQQLKGIRRYMVVAAFALAAILTPPDVISQLMLGIPLILLYEVSLAIMWFGDRKKREAT
jgi:sec-independent protein translocase protein TatC